MNVKQLAALGGIVFAISKFYFQHDTKTAAIIAATAAGSAAVVDNIFPK